MLISSLHATIPITGMTRTPLSQIIKDGRSLSTMPKAFAATLNDKITMTTRYVDPASRLRAMTKCPLKWI